MIDRYTEQIDTLLQSIAKGYSWDRAARYSRIPFPVFLDWIDKGQKQKAGIYRDLWKSIDNAGRAATADKLRKVRRVFPEEDSRCSHV